MRLTILLVLISFIPAFGWKKHLSEFDEIAMGKDITGNMIMGRYVYCDEPPKLTLTVEGRPYLIFLMKKEIVVYDYLTDDLKCVFKLPKNSNFLTIYDNGLLISKNIESYKSFADRETMLQLYGFDGKLIWEAAGNYALGLRDPNVMVSKNATKSKTNKGLYDYHWTARDAATGEKLWEKDFNCNFHHIGCSMHKDPVNKETIYFIADSLIRLNMLTGELIAYPFNSGRKASRSDNIVWTLPDTIPNYTLNRELRYSYGTPGALTGTHSNWIENGDTLFIADADYLYAFNKDLRPYWKTALPEGLGAKSSIYRSGNRVFLFNYATAFCEGIRKKCGAPFAASFDINDGKMLTLTVPELKDKVIGGYFTDDGRIYWQTITDFYYSDEGENKLHKINWKSQTPYLHNEARVKNEMIGRIGVIEDDTLKSIIISHDNLLVENGEGNSFIVHPEDGEEKMINGMDDYHYVTDNVYLNHGDSHGTHDFIYLDPDTKQIIYKFKSKGLLNKYKDSHLIFYIPQGVGIIDLKQFRDTNSSGKTSDD